MKEILKLFKALADSTRLRILMLLMQRELCVCELMFILKMEQSRISHQLRILRDGDLVEDKRQGRWIVYTIPKDVRKNIVPLLKQLIKNKGPESKVILQDLEAFRIRFQDDVRKRRGSLI